MKNYIGRKCKGFRFEDETDDIPWVQSMEKHIGEIGVIVKQGDFYVIIEFQSFSWRYPIYLIEPHLIDVDTSLQNVDTSLQNVDTYPEIPQLGKGVEMEVSANCIEWFKRNVIAKKHDGLFISDYGSFWKHARPIQEVKKLTMEELESIVGFKFEIVNDIDK